MNGLLNVRECCEWIVSNSTRKSKAWTGASLFLARIGKKQKVLKSDKKECPSPVSVSDPALPEISIPKLPDLENCEDGDFNGILDGFRKTVQYVVKLCEESASDSDEAMLQPRLRTAGSAIEQLRKAEQSVLEIMTARKSLLPAEDVKNAYTMLANNVRLKLLQLPIKLAPELVNISSIGEVQRIIEDEVRTILDNLSSNPFGDG